MRDAPSGLPSDVDLAKRAREIKSLEKRISQCRICVDDKTQRPLPHEPRPVVHLSATARICIAGQAPGMRVHKTGLPFNDPSGDRLRDWMQVDRETFYNKSRIAIVPMGFCFPGYDSKGGDLPPRRECKDAWHQAIFELMPQLELILVIGQYAQRYHLGPLREKTLTATVQKTQTFLQMDRVPKLIALPHPSWRNTSWLKKNPWFEAEILPLLRREVRYQLDSQS